MCAFFIKTARLQAPAKSQPGKELAMVRNQREQQVHAMHAYMRVTNHSTLKLEAFSMASHHNRLPVCKEHS